jgi:tetratricopeptide (TPR) repeat protein
MPAQNQNLYLEKVADQQWRFVYGEPLLAMMDTYDEACSLLEEGDIDEAAVIFREIIENVPEFFEAYSQLGLTMLFSGQEDEWQSQLELGLAKILPLFPEDFFTSDQRLEWGFEENRGFLGPYANLGFCHFENGETEKAKMIFERILKLNPYDNQGVRDPLLNCYLRLKQLDQALELANLFQEDMLPSMTFGRALVLFTLGKKDEAKQQLISNMEYSPLVGDELVKTKHVMPKGYDDNPEVELGSEEEAFEYWETYGDLWEATPGALEFAKETLKAAKI